MHKRGIENQTKQMLESNDILSSDYVDNYYVVSMILSHMYLNNIVLFPTK